MEIASLLWHALAVIGVLVLLVWHKIQTDLNSQFNHIAWVLCADARTLSEAKATRILRDVVSVCAKKIGSKYRCHVQIIFGDLPRQNVLHAIRTLWVLALTPKNELVNFDEGIVVENTVVPVSEFHHLLRQQANLQKVIFELKGEDYRWHFRS